MIEATPTAGIAATHRLIVALAAEVKNLQGAAQAGDRLGTHRVEDPGALAAAGDQDRGHVLVETQAAAGVDAVDVLEGPPQGCARDPGPLRSPAHLFLDAFAGQAEVDPARQGHEHAVGAAGGGVLLQETQW